MLKQIENVVSLPCDLKVDDAKFRVLNLIT